MNRRKLLITLGSRIKMRRVLCWFSQEEFAKRVHVSRRQVVYWESNEDRPSVDSLRRICEVLNVSADWLLTGKGRLRDIFDQGFAHERQKAHLRATAAHRVRLCHSLPLALNEKKPAVWINVAPEDSNAIALAIDDDAFSPTYTSGDTLLMKPVNFSFNQSFEREARATVGDLDSRHVIAVHDGKSSLSQLELEISGRDLRAHLHPIAAHASARKIITAKPGDDLLIQAVVYKCVRSV